jgi:succinylarginine dihydrolase
MFIVIAVVDVLLFYFNKKSQNAVQNYAASASVIDMCEAKARQLWVENKGAVFASQLEAIVEMLTYANKAVASTNDSNLVAKIDELSTLISINEINKVSEVTAQIQNMLKLRVELTKKTGSF